MYCSACDEVLGDNITIPATGVHTEVSIPGREATCKEEGLTEGKKCSVCGEKDPAYTPAPTPTTAPTTAPAASTKGLDNVPKTGDVMPAAVLGVLAILGMGAVLVKKAFSVR
mgnify:FL=1